MYMPAAPPSYSDLAVLAAEGGGGGGRRGAATSSVLAYRGWTKRRTLALL